MRAGRRWLEETPEPGARALRQALDEAAPAAEDHAFARERVWARVQAPWWDPSGKAIDPPAGSRHGWLPPLLAGAGIALVAAVTVLIAARGWRSEGSAPVATVAGPPASAPPAPAELAPVPAEPVVNTGSQRRRQELAGGVQVELFPRTTLVPGQARVAPEVKRGRVRFSVPHQPPGRRYRVRAGSYQVVVLGTTFDVAVADRGVSVGVVTGTVEVQEAGSERVLRRLTAGQRWSSQEDQGPAPAPADTVRRSWRPVRRPAVVDPAGARALEEAGSSRAHDPVRALQLYRAIVEAGGPLAETALYEMAVIQDGDLREPEAAVATWQQYRDRYPRGMLRAEADLSILSAWSRLGRSDRALPEARAFLAQYPHNERRAEVARLAGDLARASGDCRSALGFYDQALDSGPSDEDAGDALFYRALCLGDRGEAGAADAARAYLLRFPLGRHAAQAQRLLSGGAGEGAARR